MTESNQRTSSVRRTVTIAVALVAGQLALCSVIGWVTFGDLLDPEASGQRAVGASPVAGVEIPDPPSPSAAPSAGPSPSRTTPARTRTALTRSTPPPPRRPAARPTPSSSRPRPTGSAGGAVLLPAPADEEAVQEPVERWALCTPRGALGRTADGDLLRCRRARDGELRWRPA